MSAKTREKMWDEFARAIETFDKKNADYGDAWKANGWRGNLSRVFEKNQRVRNLLWRSDPRTPAVGDEQAVDTLRDMLNTIVFAIMNLQEEVEYGHEVPRSERAKLAEEAYTPGVATTFYEQVNAEQPLVAPVGERVVQEFSHGPNEVVRTEIIDSSQLQAALVQGPDEVRPVEAQSSGHVKRKSGPHRERPIQDNPQG